MIIEHKWGLTSIKSETKENIRFLLTNKLGGYFCLAHQKKSRYDGFFVHNKGMFKIIDNIIINNEIKKIINHYNYTERQGKLREKFFVPYGFNTVVLELSKPAEAAIILDVKQAYDSRQWGRYYDLHEEDNKLIIHFTKRTDDREDETHNEKEFEFFIAIRSDNIQKVGEWHNAVYEYDIERSSPPYERYVYTAAKTNSTKTVISVSPSKEHAKHECDFIFENTELLKKNQREYCKRLFIKKLRNKKIDFAYKCAVWSLDMLTTEHVMVAGLPWFFQEWSRDETVSLKALSATSPELTKKIMLKLMSRVKKDGRIPNMLSGKKSVESADSTGWLIKRFAELQELFTSDEKKIILKKLELAINNISKHYSKQNLVYNKKQETWMDTNISGMGREGNRIEIQSLQLFAYSLLKELNKKYSVKEKNLLKSVRQNFINKNILFDGLGDPTIRPNLFLAAYIYPQLLTKKEWEQCIDNGLSKLWNDWGGLSTIDKNHPLFKSIHTGENPASYHNGDSWYWINNLAAILMNRINKNKYQDYINKILEASTNEILFLGAIGHHAELSSAIQQKSEGCFAQAWSNAMYIELVEEIY